MSRQGPITVTEARASTLASASALAAGFPRQRIAVASALDRVLAEDVVARGEVPPFAGSAMDGYAVLAGPAGRILTVIGESRAGRPTDARVSSSAQAIRISTGASLPAGADAVIRQEDTRPGDEDTVVTTTDCGPGENVRYAGEDLGRGARVLSEGTRLGFAELGAAVAAGAGELTVSAKPRLAVLCTGDELQAPGTPLGPGEIHNSNAVTLAALASRAGAEVIVAERVPDDSALTRAMLAAAIEAADVVIVSGGVSVGPHDHVKAALHALGVNEIFWRVALRPGGPVWFGATDQTLVFGLPGNPVSAAVTFTLFAMPAIACLQGARTAFSTGQATLGAPVDRHPTREQAVRVTLGERAGARIAAPTGPQGSHLITSLIGADALALIAAGEGAAQAGDRVPVIALPA